MPFRKNAVLLAGLMFIGSPGSAAEITRHAGASSAIILTGVTLPPGVELAMLSGQVASPVDPTMSDSAAAYGDTRTQTIGIFRKIDAALKAIGYGIGDIVKLTVFIVGDPKLGGKMDFAGFNAGYRQFFGTPGNPKLVARSTVQVVALAGPHYLLEIEAIAARVPAR